MRTNVYDDTSLEEIRGRIRRINGHRTSSLSDIKNFQASIDVSSLKGGDSSTILISESTLLELKSKVDESETQKHFMNALKERLKETTHEKDQLLKRVNADQETIRRNNEEIEQLREEISRLNGNVSELKGILESSKQRIAELETSNDGNNIMTGMDMQSRIESMVDCTFKNKEVKTLQDELLLNDELSPDSSETSSKVTVKSNIRHVLFNDRTERFGDSRAEMDQKRRSSERHGDFGSGSPEDSGDAGQHGEGRADSPGDKRDWVRMMVRLNGFIDFKSKMVLVRQYLTDEEAQILGETVFECGSLAQGEAGSSIEKRFSNIGYSGPSENKVRMIFSPLKTEVGEIIYRLEKSEEDEDQVYQEKKSLLSKLDEQIRLLKDKIELVGTASGRTSGSSSRVMSFSDVTTEKSSMDSIPTINSSRSSKFSSRLKSNSDATFMMNRRLLYTLVRVKLWIMEEILYDEQILDESASSRDELGDCSSSRYLADHLESAYDHIINIDNETYSASNNEYLSIGIIQMLYILNKQWERSIANESKLLNQLQEMVRIYHRIKNYLLTSQSTSNVSSLRDFGGEYKTGGSDIDSLQLFNENNYVLLVEKELTSLGLGIFSGRDLSSGGGGNKRTSCNSTEQSSEALPAAEDRHNDYKGSADGLLSREQVNEILRHLENFPDPYIANRNEMFAIRELIRPLKSYGRRAPEPYIGFFAMMTQRLDSDIVQHDREIRAFQKVIKGLEDQCDRQQEELEELHEELEQLYDIIENNCDEPKSAGPTDGEHSNDGSPGKEDGDSCIAEKEKNETSQARITDPKGETDPKLASQLSEKEWISLCKQTSLGLSSEG
ncbi:hypothetical protein OJ252_2561 [Cryptosporidium canis]|uniref:Uncharacterized protein n=1 Tax=Cryptosporidium canis TaxID=195482 RepID=A0ABQ8P5A6_9CRYT|nr:hypothetical protein OJ252_2561 [Cryptosporidium canis]